MTQTVKIRILDEVSVVLVGLQDTDLTYLINKYAVPAPNYFFHPLFKLGKWDGKVNYFSKHGKTYVYLLDDIIPLLVNMGYELVLEDKRASARPLPGLIDSTAISHALHLEAKKPIMLKDHQVEAVNALISSGNGLVIAATSAGKTLMCAAFVHACDSVGLRTITIVPNGDLIKQTKPEYENVGLNTGEYSGKHKELDRDHIVSTWQSLKNNPKIITMFDVVIVDECHGVRGPILNKILTDHAVNIQHRFGVTGTLPKEEADKLAVHVALGPVRYTIGASTLIDQGILSDLDIDVLSLTEDLKNQYEQTCKEYITGKPPTYAQFKDSYFPDYSSEKSYLHHNMQRIAWIASLLEIKRDTTGNVLCLVDSIPLARKLASFIPGAVVVNGTDVKSSDDRLAIYNLFETRNDVIVIATVNLVGTGTSINRIFNVVLVDIGKSFIRVIQAIGRGLRKSHDKNYVRITDVCSDLKYGKRHSKDRITHYTEAKYRFTKHKVDYVSML